MYIYFIFYILLLDFHNLKNLIEILKLIHYHMKMQCELEFIIDYFLLIFQQTHIQLSFQEHLIYQILYFKYIFIQVKLYLINVL